MPLNFKTVNQESYENCTPWNLDKSDAFSSERWYSKVVLNESKTLSGKAPSDIGHIINEY